MKRAALLFFIISWHLLERYNIVSLENVLDAEAKIKA